MHFKKEGRKEDLFVSDEDEEDNEVLTVSELTFLIYQRVRGVEFRIYHIWLQDTIQTLLLRTWLISRSKALLLTTTIKLPPPKKNYCTWKHSLNITGGVEKLDILRNYFPEAIKQFTQHQY